MLNESNVQAAKRRMFYEIGIDDVEIFEVISGGIKVKKQPVPAKTLFIELRKEPATSMPLRYT